MTRSTAHPASFRDPAGAIFTREGVLYRQINRGHEAPLDRLYSSGLYDRLAGEGSLIPHRAASSDLRLDERGARVLEPERIPFISYPYEWCFSHFKQAALLTLALQRRALEAGLSLKDASAFNIQWHQGRLVLIDIQSFELYEEGRPWAAYRQFCEHFLAPLALMTYCDLRYNILLERFLDGVPLGMAAAALPLRSRLRFGLLTNLFLHAAAQKRVTDTSARSRARPLSKFSLLALIDSLEGTIRALRPRQIPSSWIDYYRTSSYSRDAQNHKQGVVRAWIREARPGVVWDLGANTGEYSRIAAEEGALVLALERDPLCVEHAWRQHAERSNNLLPLVIDCTNPSPPSGWLSRERSGLVERGPADLVMALALIHHLAFAGNASLEMILELMARSGKRAIVEFVPKSDTQVQRLIAQRGDLHPCYSLEGFLSAAAPRFRVVARERVPDSERELFLLERRE